MKRKIKCLWTTCFSFDRSDMQTYIYWYHTLFERRHRFVRLRCVSIECHRCAKEMGWFGDALAATASAAAAAVDDANAEKWCYCDCYCYCCWSAAINKTNVEKNIYRETRLGDNVYKNCVCGRSCSRNSVVKILLNQLYIEKKTQKINSVCVDWSGTG